MFGWFGHKGSIKVLNEVRSHADYLMDGFVLTSYNLMKINPEWPNQQVEECLAFAEKHIGEHPGDPTSDAYFTAAIGAIRFSRRKARGK